MDAVSENMRFCAFSQFSAKRAYQVIALVVIVLLGLQFSSHITQYGRMVLGNVSHRTNIFFLRNTTRSQSQTSNESETHACCSQDATVVFPTNTTRSENATVAFTTNTTVSENETAVSTTSATVNENATSVTPMPLPVTQNTSAKSLEVCPLVPPNLVTRLKIITNPPPIEEQERIFTDLIHGGRYTPRECQSRHRVAIIIPYRDRWNHLLVFLNHMHPMLKRQQLDYGIFVVEQAGKDPFNRGKLLNVGFLVVSRLYDYQCFIFHDVDMIPEDDRNLYTCSEQPKHLTVAISKFSYRLPYLQYFGGGCALTKKQVEVLNGFSNVYWGWGAEDDDMYYRIHHHKYSITRYSKDIARYKTLAHKQAEASPERLKFLNQRARRFKTDGINSASYTVLDVLFKKLYTWILVDLHYEEPSSA